MEVKEAAVKYQEDGRLYTYADYETWDDGNMYELIDGVPYLGGRPYDGVPGKATMMAPPPVRRHQAISRELFLQIGNFLKGKPCEVYAAPFGVRLNAAKNDDRVLLPDIVVVCDKSKLDDKGMRGAPDMVIEILSPSTSRHDRIVKLNKYLEAGVKEYWMVDPADRTVSVCLLKSSNYVLKGYADEDTVPVSVLDGCSIDLAEVFAE